MDKQIEQRIRERAYELWMQHGSQPGRADEYWYQAEQEILGPQDRDSEEGAHPIVGSDETSPLEAGGNPAEGEEAVPFETSPAPLGMTSETLDEVLSSPAAAKPRRRKSTPAAAAETASELNDPSGQSVAAPKRRRSTKSTS